MAATENEGDAGPLILQKTANIPRTTNRCFAETISRSNARTKHISVTIYSKHQRDTIRKERRNH